MKPKFTFRKMDHEIRIENPLKRLIATVDSCETKILCAVTFSELKEIYWVAEPENFQRLIENLVEEIPEEIK